jgi:Ax21 family sulfation-dependent quorum factor
MNMKYSLLALAPFALMLPLAADAQQQPRHPSYNYVEAGYTRFNTTPRIDGYTINGSFGFGAFHVFGGFSDLDARRRFDDDDLGLIDTLRPSVDVWTLGLGWAHRMNENMDLVVRGAYERVRLGGIGALGGSDDGWFAEFGARSLFTDAIEGHAFVGWRGVTVDGLDLGDWSGEFYGRLGATWHFTPRWALTGDMTLSGGDRLYFIGPRFNF